MKFEDEMNKEMFNFDEIGSYQEESKIKKILLIGVIVIISILLLVFSVKYFFFSSDDSIVLPKQAVETSMDTQGDSIPIVVDNGSSNNNNIKQKKNDNFYTDAGFDDINENDIEEVEPIKYKKTPVNEKPLETTRNYQSQSQNQNYQTKSTYVTSKETINNNSISRYDYYIQVAAVIDKARVSNKFLRLIRQKGYNYIIYRTTKNINSRMVEVRKVLIGPFKSKEEVNRYLPIVRKDINSQAFIFRKIK